MKVEYFPVVCMVALLAACGGGGSSSGSIGGVTPPAPPPIPLAVPKAVWKIDGALEPSGSVTTTSAVIGKGAATGAATESLAPVPTPSPIVAAPCDPRVNSCITNKDSYSNPTVQVFESPGPTPDPNSTPTVTTCGNEVFQYQGSPFYTYQLATQSTPDTCSVTMNFPDGTSATNTVVRMNTLLIGCMTAAGLFTQPGGGYSTDVPQGINLDTGTYTTDPTQADFYITGPQCPGNYTANFGAPLKYQINFPGGATLFNPNSANFGIMDVTQAMFASPPASSDGSWNDITSIAFDPNRVVDPICRDALACYVILKSSGGNFYGMYLKGVNAQNIDSNFPGDGTSSQTSGFWIQMVYRKL